MMGRRTLGANDRLRIVLLGYMVRGPVGGMAWSDLHYLMGLLALGHEVYFLEDSGDTPWPCYDPERATTDTDPFYGLAFIRRVFERMNLGERWSYYDAHTNRWFGLSGGKVFDLCRSADLLIDLLGLDLLRPWLMTIPVRAMVDKDPVFRQVRHIKDPSAREVAAQHTAFFSFGENIESSSSGIPTDGLAWRATRHPIFLDSWPLVPPRENGNYTTIMLWNSYAPVEHAGKCYGMKSDSFNPYMDLPGRTQARLELVVGGPGVPRPTLREHGWTIRDSHEISLDLWSYQDYIQNSKAEFSVAKHGYVTSKSGWFSERSASYLASGRPVLVQETGFSEWLPTGSGVVAFKNPEEALAGVEEINRHYESHCRAARAVAEEYFDSRKVLTHLVERAMK